MMYDAELEKCMVAAARRYAPDLIPATWKQPGDLGHLPHDFARLLLRHDLLVLVGDRAGHSDDSLRDAAQRCYSLYKRLYRLLADKLFAYTLGDSRMTASYCDASDFIVVTLHAPGVPIIEALGTLVTPFVVRHYLPQSDQSGEVRQLVDNVLTLLQADELDDADYEQLRDAMIALVNDLCAMPLRPLPLLPDSAPDGEETQPYLDSGDDDASQPLENSSSAWFNNEQQDTDDQSPLQGPIPRL